MMLDLISQQSMRARKTEFMLLVAMMQRISHLLNLDAETITGKSLGENIKYSFPHNDDIIRSVDNALDPEGGLAVLKGNLAPTGAIIKPTAASSELMVHKGSAVVFEDVLNRTHGYLRDMGARAFLKKSHNFSSSPTIT